MSSVFSGPEIIEMAIRTEENGQKFYNGYAERSKVEGVKSLFSFLADEEKKHIEDFNKLYEIVKETGETMFVN